MKNWVIACLLALCLIFVIAGQEGPGGPGSETVARPKKKTGATPADDADPNQAKIPSKLTPRNKEEANPDVNFQADASLVTVDVAVLDNKGNPIPQIPKTAFRILEDNVPQTIKDFSVGQAPITVALVVEFSNRYQSYWSQGWYETLQASYGFTQTLRPDDYIAIIAYDLRTEILADFTNDKQKISEAMSRLRIPGFSESNMFDALSDTADRMSKIEGRKAIVLVTSGIDTFSHITYDKARKSLQDSGVPVYSIGILQLTRQMAEARGANTIDFLQGDNELRTFAKETGGQAFFPRFMQEMPTRSRRLMSHAQSVHAGLLADKPGERRNRSAGLACSWWIRRITSRCGWWMGRANPSSIRSLRKGLQRPEACGIKVRYDNRIVS